MSVEPRSLVKVSAPVLALLLASCGTPAPAPSPTSPPEPTATQMEEPTVPPEPPEEVAPPATEPTDPVALGRSLAARNGCAACHSTDGTSLIGPTWQGLFGKQETLADGTTVLVDDAYLIESILNPNAKIVRRFTPGIMPQDFGGKLSEDQIQAIIAYIKTL